MSKSATTQDLTKNCNSYAALIITAKSKFEQLLEQIISNSTTIVQFNKDSEIGDKEAIALAEALKVNYSIAKMHLTFSYNSENDEAVTNIIN